MTRVRFAPSPTGYLHIGNARAAVVNWLYALKMGGKFILRLDDTDLERSKEEFAQQIIKDLNWLGIHPAETVRQSDRLDRYAECVAHLKATGRLYPCYETSEELEMKRKLQLSRGKPPTYDREALKLTDSDKAALEAQGVKPHWRFLLNDAPIHWVDLVRGPVTFQGAHLSDPILIRSDNQPVYTMASVVDDMDMGITDIIRGEDHVTNSAVQVQLFEALGASMDQIQLGHFPLITNASGEGFSKREGSLSLMTLQERGIEAMAIFSLIAKLGTSEEIHPEWEIGKLVTEFDLKKFSRSTPKFDANDLTHLSQLLLHKMPYETASERLNLTDATFTPEFWSAIRGNLTSLSEVSTWQDCLLGDAFQPAPTESPEIVQAALDTFPEEASWTEETWSQWTKAIQAKTQAKGKALYLPLRQALTGMEHGPEMRLLLPFIGPERARKRLQTAR